MIKTLLISIIKLKIFYFTKFTTYDDDGASIGMVEVRMHMEEVGVVHIHMVEVEVVARMRMVEEVGMHMVVVGEVVVVVAEDNKTY